MGPRYHNKYLKSIRKTLIFAAVSRLTANTDRAHYSRLSSTAGDKTISKDSAFDDCVILSKEAFDPDAVFLDDIVDDEVLPYLSLAVDGLTDSSDGRKGKLELRPEDVAANDEITPDTTLPPTRLDPEQLEVYGWESSLWKKLRRYIGF